MGDSGAIGAGWVNGQHRVLVSYAGSRRLKPTGNVTVYVTDRQVEKPPLIGPVTMTDKPSRSELDPTPSPADIARAKAIVVGRLRERTETGLQDARWREIREAVWEAEGLGPAPHRSKDEAREDRIERVKLKIATAEAVHGLLANGVLVPTDSPPGNPIKARVPYKTPRRSGAEDFPGTVATPPNVRLSLTASVEKEQAFLFDPDLYFLRTDLTGAHRRVKRSIREAVTAFRKELYLASAVMLGSASEGAWLEFFAAFNKWAEANGAGTVDVNEYNLAETVIDSWNSLSARGRFKQLASDAGVSRVQYKALVVEYDYLREVRNFSAHFEPGDKFDLGYSSVSSLLMRSSEYFRNLYRMKQALASET